MKISQKEKFCSKSKVENIFHQFLKFKMSFVHEINFKRISCILTNFFFIKIYEQYLHLDIFYF